MNFIKENYLADGCQNLFSLLFNDNATTRMHARKFTAEIVNKSFNIYGVASI